MANKNKKQSSAVNRILLIQLVVMLVLLLIVTLFISTRTRQNARAHMAALNDERAIIINNYVENAEKTLVAFSHAKQVTDILKNPTNEEFIESAQYYTEEFSKDIPFLVGIYISSWDTTVRAHTNPLVRGMVTIPDQTAQDQLHDAMTKAGRGVYNTGIIVSPATGKQIISMYKAVYDENHKPIGLVGLGIFTEGLNRDLSSVVVESLENSVYSIVNAETDRYAIHSNMDMFDREHGIPEMLELTLRAREYISLNKGEAPTEGRFEYRDEDDGKKYLCNWYYLEDHNWFLFISDRKSEVYSLSNSMIVFLAIFGALICGLWVVFRLLNKRQETINSKLSSQIVKTEKTKESLTTAMFKDILTDASNRVSFSVDASNFVPSDNQCFYFVFVNIAEFSQINSKYGNDAGDQVLLTSVEALRKVFQDGTVYRTGSDEFIVVIPSENSPEGYNSIINMVNTAHAILLSTVETPSGNVTPGIKIAVAKKTSGIDTSVISVLKDITNRSGETVFEQVQFIDLDQQL